MCERERERERERARESARPMEESVAQAHKQKIYDATKTKKTKTSAASITVH